MARLNDRRWHTALLDSRACGLQEKIDIINDGEYLGVRQYNGATLHELSGRASRHLDRYPFDVVYIAWGVCDITSKDDLTKAISFEWNPPPPTKWLSTF